MTPCTQKQKFIGDDYMSDTVINISIIIYGFFLLIVVSELVIKN